MHVKQMCEFMCRCANVRICKRHLKQTHHIIYLFRMKWHIGCSGFHYKDWRGKFYPEKLAMKNWFGYYTKFFDTVELNVTFYRFPQLPFLQNWYQKSPGHFRFSVKAP